MKAFFDSSIKSYGILRIVSQLEKYMPKGVERVLDINEADLDIIHVIGRHDHNVIRSESDLRSGRKYAVLQYVMQSCRNPRPEQWLDLWGKSKVMWSYYNLAEWHPGMYLAPLGADPNVFYKEETEKKYLLGTMGDEYRSECFGEANLAVFRVMGKMIHIGPKYGENPIVTFAQGITDDELRNYYNQCRWFSVLRRNDGFEMIGLEALLCGVRPIMFDTPNYRQWYDGLAEFIPEKSVADTSKNLINVLKSPERTVTQEEMEFVKNKFNWKTIIEGFWEQCLN